MQLRGELGIDVLLGKLVWFLAYTSHSLLNADFHAGTSPRMPLGEA